MTKFRELKPEEIEVRVQSVKANGFVLLLYKDARCDMNILDETVGPFNWQREHTRENANCIVSIWDDKKQQWIKKEDTGTESNTEKQKGLASDSFKRACFNWGIGRELYTAPFTWVSDKSYIKKDSRGKDVVYEKFHVSSIVIKNKIIEELEVRDSKGKVVFTWIDQAKAEKNRKLITAIEMILKLDSSIQAATLENKSLEELKKIYTDLKSK